ncbi:hypothetical protein N7495_004402 [Penicillium taxi]|uniref:uncharacterized protein n=1 Tax=Penicillium taxi TaxID=168475 RepID=UPI002545B6FC|nr:uncharacterized protein N7495_004402 [Penicillium taxi]KAJ5899658.1 hypothetical protein N7495_004402 [Penicillium taxi]
MDVSSILIPMDEQAHKINWDDFLINNHSTNSFWDSNISTSTPNTKQQPNLQQLGFHDSTNGTRNATENNGFSSSHTGVMVSRNSSEVPRTTARKNLKAKKRPLKHNYHDFIDEEEPSSEVSGLRSENTNLTSPLMKTVKDNSG